MVCFETHDGRSQMDMCTLKRRNSSGSVTVLEEFDVLAAAARTWRSPFDSIASGKRQKARVGGMIAGPAALQALGVNQIAQIARHRRHSCPAIVCPGHTPAIFVRRPRSPSSEPDEAEARMCATPLSALCRGLPLEPKRTHPNSCSSALSASQAACNGDGRSISVAVSEPTRLLSCGDDVQGAAAQRSSALCAADALKIAGAPAARWLSAPELSTGLELLPPHPGWQYLELMRKADVITHSIDRDGNFAVPVSSPSREEEWGMETEERGMRKGNGTEA